MTREQRLARMRELLEPMRVYLHELHDEEKLKPRRQRSEAGPVETD